MNPRTGETPVRAHCTCHDISEATFRAACAAGADSVKACFKHIGRMPKCANCVPMIRKVLGEEKA